MKKRATILISGDVQDVGFRGKVMRLGQKAGLVGYVENLPDGTVRAICEGEEKAVKMFVSELDIRNKDICVENIDVGWSEAKDEFEYFEVRFSDIGAEIFQGFATAGRMLGDVRDEVRGVGQKVDDVGKKVEGVGQKVDDVGKKVEGIGLKVDDVGKKVEGVGLKLTDMHTNQNTGFEQVEAAVQDMHSDMNVRFDTLDEKYGEFGSDVKDLKEDIGEMKKLSDEFREFKDLFAIYVKHQIKK